MNRTIALCCMSFAFIFLFSTCDSYVIDDYFTDPGETLAIQQGSLAGTLSLTIDRDTLEPGETVNLYPAGGVKPYTFVSKAEDLYTGTATNPLGVISNTTFSAGTAYGKITLIVLDDKGASARTTVTVVPKPPTGFTGVRSFDRKSIYLSWQDSSGLNSVSYLLRKTTDEVAFTDIDVIVGSTTYPDSPSKWNTTNIYYLYAVAGLYKSSPVDVTVPLN